MPPQNTSSAPRFSFDVASVWALIATLIVSAFFIIPSASIPFLYTKVALLAAGVLVTLAFFILARLTRGNIVVPPLLALGALFLPALAYALSALFSGAGASPAIFGRSLEPDTLGFILIVTLLGAFAALVLRRAVSIHLFFKYLAYAGVALVAVQTLIVLAGQVMPDTIAPTLSLVGSFEDLAILMGLFIVCSLLALRFLTLAPRERLGLFVAGALALFLLALANIGLVWILVGLVSLGLFVEAVMRRAPSHESDDLAGVTVVEESSDEASLTNMRSLVPPLATLAVALFFLLGGTLGNALASTFHVSLLDVRPSWQSTLSVGEHVYATSPLFGSGPGTFGDRWLAFRDASLNTTIFWNIDFASGIGFIPTSFVTTGLLGALAWLLFLGVFVYAALRGLVLRAPADPFLRFAGILAFSGAAYLFIVAIFSVPGPIPLALAFVFAGTLASLLRHSPGYGERGVVFAKSPRLGFLIVFALTLVLLASIAAAYSLVERYLSGVYLARSASALSAGDYVTALAEADQSAAFSPTVAAYQLEGQAAIGQMGKIASDASLSATDAQAQFQQALQTGINAALTASRLAPADYQNWILLGNLYGAVVPLNVTGAYDNAKAAYEKARALNPTSPSILYALAQLEVANKDSKAAKAHLAEAIVLKQDYTQAIFLLSQLEVADGNIKEALAAAEAAAYFTPSDPNVLFQLGILRAASEDMPGAIEALSAAVSANPNFANARYFLAVAYAAQKDYANAIAQLEAVAALSPENATSVEDALVSLRAGKNPFPASLLSAGATAPAAK